MSPEQTPLAIQVDNINEKYASQLCGFSLSTLCQGFKIEKMKKFCSAKNFLQLFKDEVCFAYMAICIEKRGEMNKIQKINAPQTSKRQMATLRLLPMALIQKNKKQPLWQNFCRFSIFRGENWQFFEKMVNFGHFSGPFRLKNDQIYFYTLNDASKSLANNFSH